MTWAKDFTSGFRFGFEHPITAIASLIKGNTEEKMRKHYGDSGGRWGSGGVPIERPAGFGDSGGRWGSGGVPTERPAGFGDTGATYLQPVMRRIIGQPQVQSPNHAYFLS